MELLANFRNSNLMTPNEQSTSNQDGTKEKREKREKRENPQGKEEK
jgi:hypothetical protein